MTQRHRLTALALLGMVSACGANDQSALVKSCIDQGGEQADCKCFVNLAKEKLPPETFSKLTELSQAGDNRSEKFLQEMSIEDAAALVTLSIEAGQTCKISGLDGLLP